MDLDDVLAWFNGRGFPFQWRKEPKVGDMPAILRPLGGRKLGMAGIEVAIVIPDIHLGVGNDVFRTASIGAGHGPRFLRFLEVLAELRDQVGANAFRVVQVGDWYDFFRAPLPTVELQVEAIEGQYPEICAAARALPVLHCIGNHDAALYNNPRATASHFGIAQAVGSPSLMAYHGHDSVTLETIERQDLGATIGLGIVDLVAMIPFLGQIADFIQMVADDSFQETWTHGNLGGDNPWPPSQATPPAGWSAPFVARDDAAALVRAARGLEYVTRTPIEAVFVGHTHRPGIASAWITAERQVALIDAGSWTYGRAEIAIVTPNGVGLAAIPMT